MSAFPTTSRSIKVAMVNRINWKLQVALPGVKVSAIFFIVEALSSRFQVTTGSITVAIANH